MPDEEQQRPSIRPIKNDPLFTVVRPVPTLLSPEGVVELLQKKAETRFPHIEPAKKFIVNFSENATAMDQAIILQWCDAETAVNMHGAWELELRSGAKVTVNVFHRIEEAVRRGVSGFSLEVSAAGALNNGPNFLRCKVLDPPPKVHLSLPFDGPLFPGRDSEIALLQQAGRFLKEEVGLEPVAQLPVWYGGTRWRYALTTSWSPHIWCFDSLEEVDQYLKALKGIVTEVVVFGHTWDPKYRKGQDVGGVPEQAAAAGDEPEVNKAGTTSTDSPSSTPFSRSLDLLATPEGQRILRDNGIRRIGLTCHPQGGPEESIESIDSSFRRKLQWAQEDGLKLFDEIYWLCQLCYNSDALIAFEQFAREELSNDLPLVIGITRPADGSELLDFARKTNVSSILGFVRNNPRAAWDLVTKKQNVVNEVLLCLGLYMKEFESVQKFSGFHFFSLGKVKRTIDFATKLQTGAFSVGPPFEGSAEDEILLEEDVAAEEYGKGPDGKKVGKR
eukprot:g15193.t1